jgi:hypothetical protein
VSGTCIYMHMTDHEQAIKEASQKLDDAGIEDHIILTFGESGSNFAVSFEKPSKWTAQHAIGVLNLCEERISREVDFDE